MAVSDDENNSSTNIDWKKSGFDSEERLTLKINVKKAAEYEAKKTNVQRNTTTPTEQLPLGLNKIRKRIRDAYDEDDEDNEQFAPIPFDPSNSLLNALNEDEKKVLSRQETTNQIRQQQEVGRISAIMQANKMADEAGLRGLSDETILKNVNGVAIAGKGTLKKLVKEDLAKELKIKPDKVSDKDLINLLRGVKRIRKLGGKSAVDGMDVKDVISAGGKELNEKQVAKIILEKSGRNKPKRKNIIKPKEKSKENGLFSKIFKEKEHDK